MSEQQLDIAYYRQNVAEFIERHLVNPETGSLYVLYPAELEFIRLMYTLDADGYNVYTRLLYSGPKKSAKQNLQRCC